METLVFCKSKDCKKSDFYLSHDGEEYFLFRQNYDKKTFYFFREGVRLDSAISFKRPKSSKCRSLLKVTERLIPSIKYIEKEEQIVILRQTKQKLDQKDKKSKIIRKSKKYQDKLSA